MEISIQTWPAGCGLLLSLCLMTLIHSVIGSGNHDTLCDTYGVVPGLPNMMNGVDITTFDLLPTSSPYDQRMKHPLFNFTCNEKKFWAFGFINFDLPDQIASVMTVPGGSLNIEKSLSKTDYDVREHMNVNAGVSGGLRDFSFSNSASYQNSVEAIAVKRRYVQDVSSFTSTTLAEFLPSHEMDKFINKKALAEIAKLTKPYKEDRTEYDNFIKKYGTHYISSAHFGGLLKLRLETERDFFHKRSDTELKAEVEAMYGAFVLAKIGMKSASNFFSREFDSSTEKTINYFGGDVNVLKNHGWQQWQPHVVYQPWLIKTQLVPISDMIKDEKKRENMEMAIEQHVLRSYLWSLKRLLSTIKERYPYYSPLFVTLEKRLDEEDHKEYLSGDILLKYRKYSYLKVAF